MKKQRASKAEERCKYCRELSKHKKDPQKRPVNSIVTGFIYMSENATRNIHKKRWNLRRGKSVTDANRDRLVGWGGK